MKLMFVSDIHGSLHWLQLALEKFKEEKADRLVLLGDYMYHGPRNRLPEGYNPAEVAAVLNQYKSHIAVAVRGNCDSEVDQMLLEFPMMGDYAFLYHEGRRIYVTHGHGFSIGNLPPLETGDVFIQGHTHIPIADVEKGVFVLNPGSIALPKENYPPSYGILEGVQFTVKGFDGDTIKKITFSM